MSKKENMYVRKKTQSIKKCRCITDFMQLSAGSAITSTVMITNLKST
jgi:hypothetical protein